MAMHLIDKSSNMPGYAYYIGLCSCMSFSLSKGLCFCDYTDLTETIQYACTYIHAYLFSFVSILEWHLPKCLYFVIIHNTSLVLLFFFFSEKVLSLFFHNDKMYWISRWIIGTKHCLLNITIHPPPNWAPMNLGGSHTSN